MSEGLLLTAATALWLGVLTSISPCPLATNIAAISFIVRGMSSPGRVLATGVLYTLGRMLTYLILGALLVDFDHTLAEAALKHPPREPEYRRGRGHREFMVTLHELGVSADRNTIEQTAIEAARAAFPNMMVTSHPTSRKVPCAVPAEVLQ
jgi:hypothetical protein